MRRRSRWMFASRLALMPFTVFPLMLLSLSGLTFAEQDPEAASLKFFKDLAETRNYTLGKPVSARFTPDGRSVLFLRSGPRDPVMRLYEMKIKTGKVREVLTPEAVLKGAEEKLSAEERARRERMRVTVRGFTSYELSRDGARVLLSLSGKLYVVNRSDGKVMELPSGPEDWIDPRFSPDGKWVAGVRGGELYVIDLATAGEQRVTTGATQTLTHGLAEFVAQEEMDRDSGYWWSPDSSRLVFQETDLSAVERLHIMDPGHPEQAPETFFYPRPGKANATVRLGIIDRAGGGVTWIRWDGEKFPYLARVQWKDSAPLTLLVQARDQREEKLLAVDPGTGATRELLTETDRAWLNLDGTMPVWFPDGSRFLWTTERRGSWQLELHAADGGLIRELTPVTFNLTGLVDADPKAGIAIVSGGPDPRETHLYRVSFEKGDPVRLTTEAGVHSATFSEDHRLRLHSFQLLDGRVGTRVETREGKRLADLPSLAEQPPLLPKIELTRVRADQGAPRHEHKAETGSVPGVLPARSKAFGSVKGIVVDRDGNPLPEATVMLEAPRRGFRATTHTDYGGQYRIGSVPPGRGYVLRVSLAGRASLEFRELEIPAGRTVVQNVTLPMSGDGFFTGETPNRWFDAIVIRPRDFHPGRKYPVVLDVYAGPGAKVVKAVSRAYLREQWMADHGFIVVSLDGRGTPGHGREWERAIQGNLIDVALVDQVAGLKALGEKYPEMDMSRVGVTGWSFGGYFTALAVLRRPDVFRCGVAGAPVTDWLDYDTHYTERYMGLPSANPEGYRKASALTYASRLERPLLLIHGMTDDNVYFTHTFKLADALYRAGKRYDLLPLTGTHLVSDPLLTLRLYSRIADYFREHLSDPGLVVK